MLATAEAARGRRCSSARPWRRFSGVESSGGGTVLYIGQGETDSYPNLDRICRLNEVARRNRIGKEKIGYGSVSSGAGEDFLGEQGSRVRRTRGQSLGAGESSSAAWGSRTLHRSRAGEKGRGRKGMTSGAGLAARRRERRHAQVG